MTRRDYELIAAEFRAEIDAWNASAGNQATVSVARGTLKAVAGRIGAAMAAENPRFDRARFLKACGVEQ